MRQQVDYGQIRRWRGNNRGQILFLGALLFPLLFGFMAVSLDMGYIYFQKRRIQMAADAGAIACSLELERHHDFYTIAKPAAIDDAALNGFDNADADVTVTVNNPPLSGENMNDGYCEVIVCEDEPTWFAGIFQDGPVSVCARSVAGGSGGAPFCILAMNPTQESAVLVQGGAYVDLECGVRVNSCNSTRALEVSGSATLDATSIDVCGSYDCSAGTCDPTPDTGVDPADDPFYDWDPPPPCGATYQDTEVSGATTLYPGIYAGGIVVKDGANVIFDGSTCDGVFIIAGRGDSSDYAMDVSGGSTIQGQGVSFYNTSCSNSDWATAYSPGCSDKGWGAISIAGGANVPYLQAPADGVMQGMLFFEGYDAPVMENYEVAGGSSANFEGVIHFPNQFLRYQGSSSVSSTWTMIIVDTLTIKGSSTLNSDYDEGYAKSPIPSRNAMVE